MSLSCLLAGVVRNPSHRSALSTQTTMSQPVRPCSHHQPGTHAVARGVRCRHHCPRLSQSHLQTTTEGHLRNGLGTTTKAVRSTHLSTNPSTSRRDLLSASWSTKRITCHHSHTDIGSSTLAGGGKADLDRDIALGVIEPVPVGELMTSCSRMVIARKKSGGPRRCVDY